MASNSDDKCLKKTNLLVYKKPEGQRAERKIPCSNVEKTHYKIPICMAKPKQIKVCTGAELKKMCPPKLCQCDKATSRSSGTKVRGRGLTRLLGFGLKAALAAAAWYVTYDMGLWGTTDDTHELYKSYCKIVRGPRPPKAEKWEPVQCTAEKQFLHIPRYNPYGYCEKPPVDIQRQTYNLQNSWNHAVSYIFSGIAGFPFNLTNRVAGGMSGKDSNGDATEEEEQCIPYSELPEEEREEIIQNAYKKV